MKLNNLKLIIDFDSTFVRVEALDELAAISLRERKDKKKIIDEIKKTTELGMEGKITFPQSLERRFKLLNANKKHIEELIRHLKKSISFSVLKNKKFFRDNASNIFIISGGFEEYIVPVVEDFGIQPCNVMANQFVYDSKGRIIGFDKKNLLSKENGKTKQVRKLKLRGDVWVIGDGFTDWQIKGSGAAKKFVAYAENIQRKKVAIRADHVCGNFCQFIHLISKQNK
jgi:D-3-phosphoglycerate dehydrogenase / 2-oxoglutarate reductase